MGGWSAASSKLLNNQGTGGSIAPFSSGPGGTVPQNLLTSPGYFQPPTQDFANQIFGRKSGQQQQLYLADVLAQLGIGSLGAGAQTLQQPLNYYSGILSGDRQQMLETVAPEVNTILGQYDTAKRAVSENAPRGGGTASTLANAPYSLSGQITNLLNTVRPQAAAAQTGIGQFLDTLGTTQTGQAGGLINANTLAQLTKSGQQGAAAGLLGSAIGGLLPSLLGLIPHGGTDTALNPIIPSVTPSPTTTTPDVPAPLSTEATGIVPTPPFGLSPTVPPFTEAAGAGAGGAAGLTASEIPSGAATSSIGAFEPVTNLADPFAGATLGTSATGTAGGLAPEAAQLGADVPTGSMFAPEGAYGSFAGTGADTGASAASATGGGGTSGGLSGLLASSSPAALAGGAAFGAGLPLAVLSLLGIGPSQIFGGAPDKQTLQSVNKVTNQVAQSNIQALQTQPMQTYQNAYTQAQLTGASPADAFKAGQQAALANLDQQYQQYVKGMQNFQSQAGIGKFFAPNDDPILQQLQQVYQAQRQQILNMQPPATTPIAQFGGQ